MEKNKRLIEWAFEQVMLTSQDQNVSPLDTVDLIKSSDEKDISYQPSIQTNQPYSEVIVTFVNGCDKGHENYEQALKMVGRSIDLAIKGRG
ncbi:MAG: hypothetical protein ACJASU_001021 [Cognaticolwellia sp.]|jgi:hypothetical protein